MVSDTHGAAQSASATPLLLPPLHRVVIACVGCVGCVTVNKAHTPKKNVSERQYKGKFRELLLDKRGMFYHFGILLRGAPTTHWKVITYVITDINQILQRMK